jgi:predicted RecA/RadA family phage recombinase
MADSAPQIWLVTEEVTLQLPNQPFDPQRGGRSSTDIGGDFSLPKAPETLIATRKRVPLDAAALKAQMDGLLQVVSGVFDQATRQTGLQLEEVELAVEINAEGQVSILGNGGKLADKGAIKLKFKRAT